MPAYQFYRLSPGGDAAAPIQMMLFGDEAAMRRALSGQFPTGCDVWQDGRFVGQLHAPSPQPPAIEADAPAAPGAGRSLPLTPG